MKAKGILNNSLIMLLMLVSVCVYSEWGKQIVSEYGYVGMFQNLALDSNDNPHIVYAISAGAGAYYLYWDDEIDDWIKRRIWYSDPQYPYDGYCLDMVLDSNDHPHIVFARIQWSSETHIEYWYYNGSEWEVGRKFDLETTGHFQLFYPKIRLDKNNNVYVAYCVRLEGIDNHFINCEKYDGENWIQLESIYDTFVKRLDDMEIDSLGNPNLSYTIQGWHIEYAKWNDSGWEKEIVGEGILFDTHCGMSSFTLNDSNDLYLTYRTGDIINNLSGLVYKNYSETNNLQMTLTDIGTKYSNINLDNNDMPNILISGNDYKLYHVRFENNTYPWIIEILEDSSAYGTTNSLLFDGNNTPHVCYKRGDKIIYMRKTISPEITFLGSEYRGHGNYSFSLEYKDIENERPFWGYPVLHISQDGIKVPGSPFAMDYINGSYDTGALYEVEISLDPQFEYEYYFEGYDKWNCKATGDGNDTRILSQNMITKINVYPNPWRFSVNGDLLIDNPENNYTISVYNISGELVFEYSYTERCIEIKKEEMKKLSSGVYLFVFNGEKKEIKKIAIIK